MFTHKTRVILVVAFAICLPAHSSHAQDKFEVYIGYSYLRPAFSQTEAFQCPLGVFCIATPKPTVVTTHPSLNGWGLSGTYKVIPWLGVKADFSGHYGTALGSSSANVHTFLFGLEIRRPRRVSPFAHIMFGSARASNNAGTLSNNLPYNTVLRGNDAAFASAFGGGIDVRVAPFLWVRLIQVDDLITRFNSSTQSQSRVSAGLVVHF
jgi:hypothetical protein